MILAVLVMALVATGCSDPADGDTPDAAASAPAGLGETPAMVTQSAQPTPVWGACALPYPQPPFTAETVFCRDPSGLQRASLGRVVDGDTLHVSIDGVDVTVRVFGIDTAERGEPCFGEAARRLKGLAAGGVLLVRDVREGDSFDRLLRYLYTPDGLSIDAILIAEGLAHAWTRDGALRDPLVELEMRARVAGAGCLWR